MTVEYYAHPGDLDIQITNSVDCGVFEVLEWHISACYQNLGRIEVKKYK
jgi:hypothetical protein